MKVRMGFVSNSSSSSFICRTDLSLPEIRRLLKVLFNFYKEFYNYDGDFYDMFKDPFVADNDYCKVMHEFWIEYYPFEITNYLVEGKSTIINSASDNSIPYDSFEIIERRFDARRIHLG